MVTKKQIGVHPGMQEGGNPRGRVVVMLPAYGCSASSLFRSQLIDPTLQHLRLLTFDYPGSGELAGESINAGPFFAGMVDNFGNQLEAKGVRNAVFLGNSMGAHILLQALPKLLDKRRVNGVLLIGVSPFDGCNFKATPKPLDTRRLELREKFDSEDGRDKFVRSLVAKSNGDNAVTQFGVGAAPMNLECWARFDDALHQPEDRREWIDEIGVIARLSSSEIPYGMLIGEKDEISGGNAREKVWTELLRRYPTQFSGDISNFPGAKIPGAGHLLSLESPDAVRAQLLRITQNADQ